LTGDVTKQVLTSAAVCRLVVMNQSYPNAVKSSSYYNTPHLYLQIGALHYEII